MIKTIALTVALIVFVLYVGAYGLLVGYAWFHTKGVAIRKRLAIAVVFPSVAVGAYAHNLRVARGDVGAAAQATLDQLPFLCERWVKNDEEVGST